MSAPEAEYLEAVRQHPRRVEETLAEWIERLASSVEPETQDGHQRREPGEEG